MRIKPVPHSLILEDRKTLRASGVNDVEMYTENKVVLNTSAGEVVIKGKMLVVNSLDADTGDFSMSGLVLSVCYNRFDSSENPIARLLR